MESASKENRSNLLLSKAARGSPHRLFFDTLLRQLVELSYLITAESIGK